MLLPEDSEEAFVQALSVFKAPFSLRELTGTSVQHFGEELQAGFGFRSA
jgi:hypothetical protein